MSGLHGFEDLEPGLYETEGKVLVVTADKQAVYCAEDLKDENGKEAVRLTMIIGKLTHKNILECVDFLQSTRRGLIEAENIKSQIEHEDIDPQF